MATDEEKKEATVGAALSLILGAAIIAFLTLVGCPNAHGDCLVVVSSQSCAPCQTFKAGPVVQARAAGVDIRIAEDDPFYTKQVRVLPTTIYVVTNADGTFRNAGPRIEGVATAGQLQRLSVIPYTTEVGAMARRAVRGVLGCPILLDF